MDATIKALWLTELRSGNYVQGRRFLRNPPSNTYCCLGVLCELAESVGTIRSLNTFRRLPHQSVLTWCSLSVGDATTLGNMNDGVGAWLGNPQTFTQIADYIETNL